MANIRKSRSGKAGLPPGTLMHIGERKLEQSFISQICYGPDMINESTPTDPGEISLPDEGQVLWLNINGVHDTELIAKVGQLFQLHPLILEDIVNTEQRPKTDDHDDYMFFVMKMLSVSPKGTMLSEQVSMVLGKGFVITFQESPGDVFDQVRERIRSGKGKIRRMKSDYLAYALLDAVVDQLFVVMEVNGEKIESAEMQVMDNPGKRVVGQIHDLKRQLLLIRRAAWPLRELVSAFEKSENPLLHKSTRIFLRDVYDHTIQIIDNIETSREIASGLLDVYLSTLSNRTNDVMKVLTIVASIFIPLTFIAGIYGMNFEYMPELQWAWGYPAIIFFMLVLAAGMIWIFRRKHWL